MSYIVNKTFSFIEYGQMQAETYVSVLGGGGGTLIQPKFVRPTHRSIDDTCINTAEICCMIISCKKISSFYCKSRIYLNNLYFETDCTHLETD